MRRRLRQLHKRRRRPSLLQHRRLSLSRHLGLHRRRGAKRPCRFGLVRPMTSYNLLVVEFDQWRALWRDVRSARSMREAWGYLFKPPGWRPDGRGETTEDLRRGGRVAPVQLPQSASPVL